MIDLFALRNIALLGVPAVEESGVVFFPGQAGKTSAVDGVVQRIRGGSFYNVQRAVF